MLTRKFSELALVAVADGDTFPTLSGGLNKRSSINDLAAVRPKWFGGVGDGVANDSDAVQRAIDTGRAVDLSGGTWAIKDLSITSSTTCPGMFSNGSGVLVPAPGSTSATIGITITKDNFWIDNIVATMPISTDPVVAPAFNRMFYFTTVGTAANWKITNCRITGGGIGIVAGGVVNNYTASHNYLTNVWRDGILGPDGGEGCFITDNTLADGGYATGASAPSGAIRTGTGINVVPNSQLTIARNHIARWSVNASQSVIDCAAGSAFNLDISDNVSEDCGGGIELKCAGSPQALPDIYQGIKCVNNTIKLHPDIAATAITIFYSTAGVVPNKLSNFKVSGNHIWCPTRPTIAAVAAMYVAGCNDISITDNFVFNTIGGIRIDGTGVSNTAYRVFVGNNTIEAWGAGLSFQADAVVKAVITGNRLVSWGAQGLMLESAGLNQYTVSNNYIWGASRGIELRTASNGTIVGNTVYGGTNAILSQGTVPVNVIVDNNYLHTLDTELPALSGTVSGNGAGLTDGTRIFTVTSGTGTVPTIFRCTIAAGTITSGLTILQVGSYSVFPAVPSVTVDTGIVGGATFTLTPALAQHACSFATGTGIIITKNTIAVPVTMRTVVGAGTYVAAGNVRGTVTADPSATTAGSIGDKFLNSAPASLGFEGWICTTAGNAGAAVYKGVGVIA